MLVLSRKIGESVLLDKGKISIYILGIEKGRIKIGIEAPDDVDIRRNELPPLTFFQPFLT